MCTARRKAVGDMSTFANPLNPAAQALKLAQQALDAANEAKAAAANVFPSIAGSGRHDKRKEYPNEENP